MYRFIALFAFSTLVSCQLYPGIGYNSRLNSAYPYNQGRYLNAGFGAGYNGQYYNPASATAPILSYSNVKGPDGSYSYSYATGDGKQAQETGVLKNAYIDPLTGAPAATKVVEGSYSYTSPEGTPIQVQYLADENGFRTLGDHIPADGRGVLPAGLGGLGYAGQGYNNLYNGFGKSTLSNSVGTLGYGGLGYGGWSYEGLGYGRQGYGSLNNGRLNYGGLNYGGLNFRGQKYGGFNYGGLNYGGQKYGGLNYGGLNYGGQKYGGWNYGGLNYGGQKYGGLNYEGLNYGGLNYGNTNYKGLSYGGVGYGSPGYGGLNYGSLGYGRPGYGSLGYGSTTYGGLGYGGQGSLEYTSSGYSSLYNSNSYHNSNSRYFKHYNQMRQ